jgi:hypothetical protein
MSNTRQVGECGSIFEIMIQQNLGLRDPARLIRTKLSFRPRASFTNFSGLPKLQYKTHYRRFHFLLMKTKSYHNYRCVGTPLRCEYYICFSYFCTSVEVRRQRSFFRRCHFERLLWVVPIHTYVTCRHPQRGSSATSSRRFDILWMIMMYSYWICGVSCMMESTHMRVCWMSSSSYSRKRI